MRILIVDDERPARDKLRRMLANEPGIDAIDEAADGIEALARIAACRPDALFLDIEMPELSGIELAASLPDPAPPVVFVTAWDQYAVRAFDADAIDYLLKPYDAARLQRALRRLRARVEAHAHGRAPAQADAPPEVPDDAPDGMSGSASARPLPTLGPVRQLLVSERGVTRVVRVDEIDWIETADNYVVLHTTHGRPLLRQTLAGLLDRLGPDFVRCHRRVAVRLSRIERVVALDKGDCDVVLRNGARVPCSRQYRAALVARLGAPDAAPAPADGRTGPS